MRLVSLVAALGLIGAAACDDPFALGPATSTNFVDTLQLFSVNGTTLDQPSALVLTTKRTYRLGIDLLPYSFDFLYRIDGDTLPQLVPYGAVASASGVSGRAGYQPSTTPFDAITEGQQSGYVTDSATAIAVGDVFFLRSGLPNGCFLLIPYYAKLRVLEIDAATRSVSFEILINNNCGYWGLEPGLPEK